ncbi:MAG: MFS transporter [Anaerolineae bacterium]
MATTEGAQGAANAARWSVRGLAVMAVIGMVGHGLAMTITGPALPEIMRVFDFRETAAGVLLASGSLGFMIGCLIGGFVADQLGIKPVLVAAWVGVVLSLAGFALSHNYLLLVAMYTLIGAASGVVETGLNILPTQLGGGAGLMNVVHVGYGIGALSAPLIAGAILERGGSWTLSYWLIAIVPALLAVRALSMRMPAAPRHAVTEEEHQSIWTVLRHPLVVLSAIALLFYVAAELSVSNWIVLFVGERFALSPLTASLALSTFWAAILVGRLLQGPLNARISLPALIVCSSALFGVGLLGLALAPLPALAYAFLAVAGLGASGIYPDVMIFANRRYARQIGAVTGVLSTAAAAGSFAFQPIVGRVAEVWGLQLGFLGLAACTALAALAYLPVWLGKVR